MLKVLGTMHRPDWSGVPICRLPTLLPSLALPGEAAIPAVRGESGIVYLVDALVLGGVFFCYSARFALHSIVYRFRAAVAFASVIYLPVLFTLLAFDKK